MATTGDQSSQLLEELREARAILARQAEEIRQLKQRLASADETFDPEQMLVPIKALRGCADDLLASAEPFDRAALVLRTLLEAATLKKTVKTTEGG